MSKEIYKPIYFYYYSYKEVEQMYRFLMNNYPNNKLMLWDCNDYFCFSFEDNHNDVLDILDRLLEEPNKGDNLTLIRRIVVNYPNLNWYINAGVIGEESKEAERCSRNKQSTYLIRDNNNGNIKIGKSCDVDKRFMLLSISNISLQLIAIKEEDIESELHTKYKQYHVHGEWYDLSDDILKELINEYKFKVV